MEVSPDSALLERLTYFVSADIHPAMVDKVDLHQFQEDTLRGMVLKLRALVLAEQIAMERYPVAIERYFDFYFPASPWQFFKQRHPRLFPKWFLRRWPVRTTPHKKEQTFNFGVEVKQFARFPMAQIRTPEKIRGPVVVRHEEVSVWPR